VVRKGGDEGSFGEHVFRKRIFSDYVESRAGDYLTTMFGEEEMDKQPF
jgi:hypothetical protein